MRQGAPFSWKPLGPGRLPVKLPWNPTLTLPPGGSVPFQEALLTVTVVPVWVQTPFQPLLTLTVGPTWNVSRQLLSATVVLIFTSAVNPVDH
jgi:hypothetical protein